MFAEPESLSLTTMEVDFKHLMRSHLLFKQRLEDDVRAGLNVDLAQLRDPESTDVGRWIAGADSILGSKPEFIALRHCNHDFHMVLAILVARLRKSSPPNAALPLRGISMYESASMTLSLALRSLESALVEPMR